MSEKDLENDLAAMLHRSQSEPAFLRTLGITRSTSSANTLYDLVETRPFEIFQDTSYWNTQPKLMTDVAGGITPDIVIRSAASKQNRIYIEVKLEEELRDYAPLSQIVRQFLHLLGTSQFSPMSTQPDIRRAVLLAAPSSWFERPRNRTKWHYFLDHYTELAKLPKVDITLDELRLETSRETIAV